MRLIARDLALGYGERLLFRGLDLDIPERGVTVLVGPSGSGKSSLLAALAGLLPPREGSVRFVDEAGASAPPDPARISWIPQGSNALPARSVLDNAMVGALARGAEISVARDRAHRALAELGIAAHADAAARELSGGELQRLAFARALAAETPLIFADEPTASLDVENVRRIGALLTALGRVASVVVATHDPAVMAIGERRVPLRAS